MGARCAGSCDQRGRGCAEETSLALACGDAAECYMTSDVVLHMRLNASGAG